MFVVFLSNRVHPEGKGDVTPLRARVATIAASAFDAAAAGGAHAALFTGRDFGGRGSAGGRRPAPPVRHRARRAARRRLRALRGKRVGLLTNHTGRARDGAAAIDLLHAAQDVRLVALFSPEHGIRGILDASARRRRTRRPGCRSIRSTARRAGRPRRCSRDSTRWSIDLQDIGARFYTYMTTMAYVMEEAAKKSLPVVRARPAESDQRLPDRRARPSTRR